MGEQYAAIYASFWYGATGRTLRSHGSDAQLLALYLATNRYANLIGLYRVFLEDIASDTGLRGPVLERAIGAVAASEFADYDGLSGGVWVRSLARYRLQLRPGQALAESDKRVKWIGKMYAEAEPSPYLGPFFDHYAAAFHLKERREGPPANGHARRGIDGASMGQRSHVTCTKTSVQKHTSARSAAARNTAVIRTLIGTLIANMPGVDRETLKELAKVGCAQQGIVYDASAIGSALDQALAIRAKT